MAGFTPTEGLVVLGNFFLKNGDVDRGTDLELGLYTDVGLTVAITEATITEPTGTGYARINLVDASWSNADGVFSFAQQSFTGGAGGWTPDVVGYFIATKGTAPRLIGVEDIVGNPHTIVEGQNILVNPELAFA